MVTQFEDVANQVAQEKIGDKRLRNEAIRKGMEDPWKETVANEQTTSGTTPAFRTNVNSGSGTLASTYSNLLNNSNAMGLNNYTPSGNTNSSSIGGKMPGWLPGVAGKGVGILSGNGLYGTLAQLALQGGSGDWKGMAAGGAGTLASMFAGNKLPGIGGLVGSVVGGKLNGKDNGEIGLDAANSLLGSGLSALNPILGGAYSLAKLFGLDVARGTRDYTKSDITQRFGAGLNGGYWGGGAGNRDSWNPVSPYNPTGTYSGSGYGNTAGPGSGSNGTPNNYTQATQTYGYSNPASSYAGQTSGN